MKVLLFVILFFLFGLFSSCNSHNKGTTLAKVGSHYLDKSDIEGIVSAGTSPADSALIVKNYINFWIEQQLLASYADDELPSKEKDFDKQIENYKQTLLIQAFESYYIKKNIDTTVTEAELAAYFKTHSSDFELKSNIVRLNFVKFHKGSPSIQKVKNLLFSNSPNKKLIDNICSKEAENYFLDDKAWLLFDDIIKEIPIQNYQQEQFLQNNKTIEIKDSVYYYLIVIKDFKIKDDVSPLIYERENIKSVILNTRKSKLLDKLHETIKKKAVDNSDIEIY